jgi:hypothetical protein
MEALPPPEGEADVVVDGERGDLESALLHAVAETASTIINAKNLRILILHTVQFTVKRRDQRRYSTAFHVVSGQWQVQCHERFSFWNRRTLFVVRIGALERRETVFRKRVLDSRTRIDSSTPTFAECFWC